MSNEPHAGQPRIIEPRPAQPANPRRAVARVAWMVLLLLSSAYAINHILGVATFSENDTDRLMFVGFAALNIYTVIVLLTPYRTREPWAWGITWVSVAVFAICPLLIPPPIGTFYLGSAIVMAVAQLAALPDFRRR